MRTLIQGRTVKLTAIAVIAAALFALICFVCLSWRHAIAPIERPDRAMFSSESVARGEALAAEGHCASCHIRPGGQPFAAFRDHLRNQHYSRPKDWHRLLVFGGV